MPKIRTNSSCKKRLKLTATGRLKRKKAFHSHILTKKSAKRKRNLRSSALINGADEDRALRLLGRR